MKQIALAALVAAALAACGQQQDNSATTASSDTPTTTAASEAGTGSSSSYGSSSTVAQSDTSPAPTTDSSTPAVASADTTANNPVNSPAPDTSAMGAAPAGAGQDTYTKACAMCHAAGVTGAPKPGDKADWGPRIAQGKDTLYTHALKGFTGKKGTMPPKGGNTTLADADVKAAVDFMVSQSK